MAQPTIHSGPVDYGQSIDFHELVQLDGTFKQLLVDNDGRMDWKNAHHVMQLTKCLLRRDFGLRIRLPDDRLCPPVPGRYSYIQWLQNLLDTTSGTYMDTYDSSREVTGIDIGTGASCIYPLLGTASRARWQFYATELDEKSYSYAMENIKINHLEARIKLLKINPLDQILALDRYGIKNADFVMCNPPFFASRSEMLATNDKAEPPSAVCTGAEIEMTCEGGDAGFVNRMVQESKELALRVQWYTSMLGKLSSVKVVVQSLKRMGCSNWAVGCLLTGGKTRRWVVGWSWGDIRPSNESARCDMPHKDALPFPTELTINVSNQSKQNLIDATNAIFSNLQLKWYWRDDLSAGVAFIAENVWSRAARRKRHQRLQALQLTGDHMDVDIPSRDVHDDSMDNSNEAAALVVKITTHEGTVSVRWLKGVDSILFESFCGMLKRELTKDI